MARLMRLFESAALKLTLAYLLVIMLISITFSTIIYGLSARELEGDFATGGGPNGRTLILNLDIYESLRQERVAVAKGRLIANLVLLNILTLGIGGAAAYLLARRTLRPIRNAMEEQTRFTGDASHELRTPLAAMRSEIEVALRDDRLKLTEARALLASNLEEVVSLQGLSDRLLQLSGNESLPLTRVPLASVVETALARTAVAAEAKRVTVRADVLPMSVRADRESLTDLLVILLENAVKYSESDSEVTVSANTQGRWVTLTVADRGIGIAEDELPHVFDRFYRGDGARGRSGYGLGLSIAQRIAEQHQARVQVVSEPGEGSRFSVRLQLAQN